VTIFLATKILVNKSAKSHSISYTLAFSQLIAI